MTNLFALGRALERRARHRGLRFLAVALATWGLCLAFFALVTAGATHDDRQYRAFHLGPLPVTAERPETARIRFSGFRTVDEHQVAVFVVEPSTSDSAPPPGLTAWPQPGTTAVSPRVATFNPSQLPALGTLSPQRVAAAALASPSDAVAYVRPFTPHSPGLVPISGWGDPTTMDTTIAPEASSFGLDYLNAVPLHQTVLGISATMLLTSSAGLLLACGIGRTERRAEMRKLAVMGASILQRVTVNSSRAIPPVIVGALMAIATVSTFFATTVHLPWVETWFVPRQFDTAVPSAVAAVLGATVIAGALAAVDGAFVARTPSPRARRFFAPGRLHAAWFCVGGAFGAMWLPLAVDGEQRVLVYLLGVVIVVLTFPGTLAVILRAVGSRLVRSGHNSGTTSRIVAGRVLMNRPRHIGRLAAGVGITMLLCGQITVWSSYLGRQYVEAVHAKDILGDSMVTAAPGTVQNTNVTVPGLPPDVAHLWFRIATETGSGSSVRADCATLETFDLPCTPSPSVVRLGDSPQHSRLQTFTGREVHVQSVDSRVAETSPGPQWQLVLSSRSGTALDRTSLTASSLRTTPGGLTLETPGESALVQARVVDIRARWITTWGGIGLFVMTTAAACSLLAGVLREAELLRPLAAATGSTSWIAGLMFWLPGFALVLSGIIACALYLCLPYALTKAPMHMHASGYMAVVFATISISVAAVSVGAGTWHAKAKVRAWRPGHDRASVTE